MNSFNKQPFLEADTLYLRALLPSDLDGNYSHWLNDPEICFHNSHGRFPYGLAQMEAYVRQVERSDRDLVLAIVDKASQSHVGNISLQNIQWIDRNAEFAILLGEKSFWGKGISKIASHLLLKHGFQELNLIRIHCGTSEDNIAMQKLAIAMGMKEEGRRRQAMFKHGKFLDILEYGILCEEFSGVKK